MQALYKTIYWLVVGTMIALGALTLLSFSSAPWAPKVKVVKSGSMEPSIPVGAIVIVEHQATYKLGDVITFGKDTKTQIPTTHRIVAMQGEGSSLMFQTKGDANNAADPSATSISDVEGRALVAVPYVGYALAFARTKLGFALLVGLPALLILIEEGYAIVVEVRRLRGKRRVIARRISTNADMQSRVQMAPAHMPATHRAPVAAARKKMLIDGIKPAAGALLGLLVVAGLMYAGGRASGDTLAHFASNQLSKSNSFQAGVFDPAPPAQQGINQVIIDNTPPADVADVTDESVSDSDLTVEISDPTTVISDAGTQ